MSLTMQKLAKRNEEFARLWKQARASSRKLYRLRAKLRNEHARYRKTHDAVTSYFKKAWKNQ